MEEDGIPKTIFTQKLEGTRRRGRSRKGWKEEVERDLQVLGVRRWRDLVTDKEKIEGDCSTGQSPQRAVVPMEEEGGFKYPLIRVVGNYTLRDLHHQYKKYIHKRTKHILL
jgi:hypothetical protein